MLREFQLRYRDDYALIMSARFDLPPDTKTVSDELAAVERLRAQIRIGRAISRNDLIQVGAELGVSPDPAIIEPLRQQATQCLAVLGRPET